MDNLSILIILTYFCCSIIIAFFAFIGWWVFRDDIKTWGRQRADTIIGWRDSVFNLLLRFTVGKEDTERNMP